MLAPFFAAFGAGAALVLAFLAGGFAASAFAADTAAFAVSLTDNCSPRHAGRIDSRHEGLQRGG